MTTDKSANGATYDGFISYSHAADGLLAPRLQAGLQRFAKPWWKRRAVRVFRDETSLSANPHLWSSITEALDDSAWFVLLMSPDAADSPWVNQELEYWKTHKDRSRILPVLTDGSFEWTGSDVAGSAVPDQLRGVLAEEPRWVDLRFAKDEDQLDMKDPRFADAVADIASALRGIPKDELASEEVRQHRRTIRTTWAAGVAVTLLAVLAVGFGMQAASNARIAEENAAAEAEARTAAEDNAAEAFRQKGIAEENEDAAVTAMRRLLDSYLQRRFSEVPVPGPFVRSIGVTPAPFPLKESPPSSPRLDFLNVVCGGTANTGAQCFRDGRMIHPDESRTAGIWLANTPFHIRHGFVNRTDDPLPVDRPLQPGYDVYVFVTRRAGPTISGDAFPIGETFRVHSQYMVRESNTWCGRLLEQTEPVQPCDLFVTDFPDGLPPGRYEFWIEWVAPCEVWVATETACIGIDYSFPFASSSVDMPFHSDEYTPEDDNSDLPWPVDPWDA